jgi:hypothetical protein
LSKSVSSAGPGDCINDQVVTTATDIDAVKWEITTVRKDIAATELNLGAVDLALDTFEKFPLNREAAIQDLMRNVHSMPVLNSLRRYSERELVETRKKWDDRLNTLHEKEVVLLKQREPRGKTRSSL